MGRRANSRGEAHRRGHSVLETDYVVVVTRRTRIMVGT